MPGPDHIIVLRSERNSYPVVRGVAGAARASRVEFRPERTGRGPPAIQLRIKVIGRPSFGNGSEW